MFKSDFIKKLLIELYPINRSITGEGYRSSIKIIKKYIPLEDIIYKSGEKIYDWEIPLEWNLYDGYLVTPSGKKIAKLSDHNLHIMNYSIPVNKTISYDELKKHIYTLKKIPDAIPYVHSYYKKNWGFCLKYNQFKRIPKRGKYRAFINSTFKKGKLVNSELLLKGRSKKEIMISSYLCHSQMANHELSGPIMMILIYQYIKSLKKRKYSYRFLICPENIGSLAYLKTRGKHLKKYLEAGMILNLLANGKDFTYKKSKSGNSLIDKVVKNIFNNSNKKINFIDFFPDGSDERQFSSPGFNLQFSSLMRKIYANLTMPNHKYKEYHTSLDDLNFFKMKQFEETYTVYKEVIDTIEMNYKPKAKILFGTPQLSKYNDELYPSKMNFGAEPREGYVRVLLEILNLADGKTDLIDIANKKNFKLTDYKNLINKLRKNKLIS